MRLIGDRSINERDFGKIKKDRTKEMHLWMDKVKDIQKNEKNVKTAIIAANNHYAGFGPMTAKLFAEMMNLKNKILVIGINTGFILIILAEDDIGHIIYDVTKAIVSSA